MQRQQQNKELKQQQWQRGKKKPTHKKQKNGRNELITHHTER